MCMVTTTRKKCLRCDSIRSADDERASPPAERPGFFSSLVASELLGEAVGDGSSVLLLEVDLHALEAELVGGDDVVDDDPLGHVPQQLGRVELVVGSRSRDDLGLVFDCEVLVGVGRVDVLRVQVEDLVVRDDPGVGEVVDPRESLLGHGERRREHLREDGHRVGDVDDALVLDDLGDEASVDEIVGDRHPDPEDHAVRVVLEHRLHVPLRLAVERTVEVRFVLLGEPDPGSLRVLLVVVDEDAPGRVDGAVDATFEAQIGEVESPDDVRTDRLRLVRLAPVDVGTSGDPRGVQNVRRLVLVELRRDRLAVLEAAVGGLDLDAVFLSDHVHHEPSDPSGLSSKDEDSLHFFVLFGCHRGRLYFFAISIKLLRNGEL
mmetsp:Transcript_21054/g.49952  ORF Transcript_21054/g.49952 Transcript_21054/m.49952 type:complete len:376 (-) Transcript_21054:59-1186(-)